MAATTDDRVLIRQIQGLAVLLSCLPADGKVRELFALALESPEREWADRVRTPEDGDSDERFKAWLEDVWALDAVSDEGRKLVDWQADSDNMTAALAELRSVGDRLAA
jgi:substrate-assisted peptide maturase DurN-like protein